MVRSQTVSSVTRNNSLWTMCLQCHRSGVSRGDCVMVNSSVGSETAYQVAVCLQWWSQACHVAPCILHPMQPTEAAMPTHIWSSAWWWGGHQGDGNNATGRLWVSLPTCAATHLPLDKMAAISLMIFSDAFPWMKGFVFWLEFHWSLFQKVQLTNPAFGAKALSEPVLTRFIDTYMWH